MDSLNWSVRHYEVTLGGSDQYDKFKKQSCQYPDIFITNIWYEHTGIQSLFTKNNTEELQNIYKKKLMMDLEQFFYGSKYVIFKKNTKKNMFK